MKSRITDQLAATHAGMIAAIVLLALFMPSVWAPTPRPSPQAELGSGRPSMTTEGVSRPAAAGLVARTAAPEVPSGAAPAVELLPVSGAIKGVAVWYDYVPGHAAAGPLLRRALGPTWRGTVVRVCHGDRCTRAVLSDWCACSGGRRLVDLDVRTFARLADPSVGVIRVTVSWPVDVPAPPDTSTDR